MSSFEAQSAREILAVSTAEINYDSRRWSTWHIRRGQRSWVRAREKPHPLGVHSESQQSQVVPREITAGHTEYFLSNESDAALT